MSYVENMLFQMNAFPDIVESYDNMDEQSKGKGMLQYSLNKEYVYILATGANNIADTVQEIFSVNLPVDVLQTNCCIVDFAIREAIEVKEDVWVVRTNHPFPCDAYVYYVSNIIDEEILKKSYSIFIYGERELDFFQSKLIRKCMNIDTIDEFCFHEPNKLKDAISCNCVYHKIKLDKSVPGKKEPFKAMYLDSKLLEMVDLLYSQFDNNLDAVAGSLLNELMSYFQLRCKEILNHVLEKEAFVTNYIFVEIYLKHEKEVRDEFRLYIQNKILPVLKRLRKDERMKIELQNELYRNTEINQLDDLIHTKINTLYNKLEVFYEY